MVIRRLSGVCKETGNTVVIFLTPNNYKKYHSKLNFKEVKRVKQ